MKIIGNKRLGAAIIFAMSIAVLTVGLAMKEDLLIVLPIFGLAVGAVILINDKATSSLRESTNPTVTCLGCDKTGSENDFPILYQEASEIGQPRTTGICRECADKHLPLAALRAQKEEQE